MFSLEFTPVKFRYWYLQNRKEIETEHIASLGIPVGESRSCPECYGEGKQECDLGHSHGCEPCDGTGKMLKTPEEMLEEYGRKLYDTQVKLDRKKLVNFLKEQEHASEQPTNGLHPS